MNDKINLGLGFDSRNVDDATRALKQNAKVLGSMVSMFLKMSGAAEETSKQEEKVNDQLDKMGAKVGKVGKGFSNLLGSIPGFGKLFRIVQRVGGVFKSISNLILTPIIAPFKWLLKNGLKVFNYVTDVTSRFHELKDAALELEGRFTRLANLTGSERFARKLNDWQYEMLQTLPVLRDDLRDFTVQMQQLGLNATRHGNALRGVLGAAAGPGNSYSEVMSAALSAAQGGDSIALSQALGNTLDARVIMESMSGAFNEQQRFLAILNLLNKEYGDNVDRLNRTINVNLTQISSYWSEFKENLIGTPEKGNLMWYVQQIFVDSKDWISKNMPKIKSFAASIQMILGTVGKMAYTLFKNISKVGLRSVGGIEGAAKSFKKWAMGARAFLELWVLKIEHYFKTAEDRGLSLWEMIEDIFTTEDGKSPIQKFWNKFEELGGRAIDWISEKVSKAFGNSFRKSVVSIFKKDDGSFRTLTPDWIVNMDNRRLLDEKLSGNTTLRQFQRMSMADQINFKKTMSASETSKGAKSLNQLRRNQNLLLSRDQNSSFVGFLRTLISGKPTLSGNNILQDPGYSYNSESTNAKLREKVRESSPVKKEFQPVSVVNHITLNGNESSEAIANKITKGSSKFISRVSGRDARITNQTRRTVSN